MFLLLSLQRIEMSTTAIRLKVTSDDHHPQLSAPVMTNISSDFLSPHSFPARNSISSISGKIKI